MLTLPEQLHQALLTCWDDGVPDGYALPDGDRLDWSRHDDGVRLVAGVSSARPVSPQGLRRERNLMRHRGFTPLPEDDAAYARLVARREDLGDAAAALAQWVLEVPTAHRGGDPVLGEALLASYGRAGLPCPYVPAFALPALRVRGPWCLSTRRIDPFMHYRFTDVLREDAPCFSVSHSGHGSDSYALTVQLRRPGLRLLAQVGWGGAHADPERGRAEVAALFDLVRAVDARVDDGADVGVAVSGLRAVRAVGPLPRADRPSIVRWTRDRAVEDVFAPLP